MKGNLYLLIRSRFPSNPTITPIKVLRSTSETNAIQVPDWQLEGKTPKQIVTSVINDNSHNKRPNEIKVESTPTKDNITIGMEVSNGIAAHVQTISNTSALSTLVEVKGEVKEMAMNESRNASMGKIREPLGKIISDKGLNPTGKDETKKYSIDRDLLIGYSRRTII